MKKPVIIGVAAVVVLAAAILILSGPKTKTDTKTYEVPNPEQYFANIGTNSQLAINYDAFDTVSVEDVFGSARAYVQLLQDEYGFEVKDYTDYSFAPTGDTPHVLWELYPKGETGIHYCYEVICAAYVNTENYYVQVDPIGNKSTLIRVDSP